MQNNFKAKKRFGQHFLKDKLVVKKIIQSITNDSNQIVEIGPGLGDLTSELLKKDAVYAYEVDKYSVEILNKKFATEIKSGRFILENVDILNVFHGKLLEKPYKMVANLPYNIGTEIILRGLKDPNCQSMVVMVQKEVAEKLYAKPKSSSFSSLSVLVQSIAESQKIVEVDESAFEPPPKVKSVVVKIKKNKPNFDLKFAEFVKSCFSSPRKPLIKPLLAKYGKEKSKKAFEDFGFDFLIRPHQLNLCQFESLFRSLI